MSHMGCRIIFTFHRMLYPLYHVIFSQYIIPTHSVMFKVARMGAFVMIMYESFSDRRMNIKRGL